MVRRRVGGRSEPEAPGGAFTRSPAFCATVEHPRFPFFAKSPSGTGPLEVQVGVTSVEGMYEQRLVGTIYASRTKWIVSPPMDVTPSVGDSPRQAASASG